MFQPLGQLKSDAHDPLRRRGRVVNLDQKQTLAPTRYEAWDYLGTDAVSRLEPVVKLLTNFGSDSQQRTKET